MQTYLLKQELNAQERRQKLNLKKGSVQLHGAVWDFLESRSMSGIASVAGIIRNYVMNGVRNTIFFEIDKLTSPAALGSIKYGIFKEFGRRVKLPESTDPPGNGSEINQNIYRTEVIGYFERNIEEFEEVKTAIKNMFLFITDANLVEILGEDEY